MRWGRSRRNCVEGGAAGQELLIVFLSMRLGLAWDW